MSQKLVLLSVILAFFLCGGCSQDNRPEGLPKLYPVTLTILQDDQPLYNALVFLHTENESDAKWTVSSVTDAEGKAIIVTHGQFRGSPAGKFKVCVRKAEVDEESRGVPKLIHYVDTKFGDPKKTPLEIEVPESKKMTTLTLNVHKPQ